MSEWNIPKIREECLKLMGHGIVDIGDSRKFSPHGDCGPSIYFKVVSPLGETRIVRYLDWAASNAPDPVYDLDDALPLMEKYGVAPRKFGKWTSIPWDSAKNIQEADTAPLSVCLCALLCAGHNLDDFRVKS